MKIEFPDKPEHIDSMFQTVDSVGAINALW